MLIFNALRKSNNQLKQLEISQNNITDDVCETLIAMIKDNKCLQRLEMYKNPIKYHERSIPLLLNALQQNVTLTVLGLPTYSDHIQNEILSYKKEINQKRNALDSSTIGNQLWINILSILIVLLLRMLLLTIDPLK